MLWAGGVRVIGDLMETTAKGSNCATTGGTDGGYHNPRRDVLETDNNIS